MGAVDELEQRRQRAARNQSLFREVNEQLEKLGKRLGSMAEPISFLCECLDPGCAETIRIDQDDYERVRAYPARFLVVPGHEDPAVETVVEKALRYTVVEKVGAGGVVAAANDPRRAVSAA
jgi:hypothetical protein